MGSKNKIKPAKGGEKQPINTSGLRPRWVKGQSGNPNGRPPVGKCIPDLLRRFGEWQCPESLCKKMQVSFPNAKNLTVQEAVYLRVYTEALHGESWAVQFIADRTEGKIAQILTGPNNTPLIPANYDLSKLSIAELIAFKAMQSKIEIKDKG